MSHELTLDCRAFHTTEQIHLLLAEHLQFPTYYGQNWDALYDVLTDISEPLTLYLAYADVLEAQLGRQAAVFLRVLQDAAAQNPMLSLEFVL